MGVLLAGVGLHVGCSTPEEHAVDDLTRLVESQMYSARNKMQSAGMPESGLRELDEVIQEIRDSMRQFEKETKRLERQVK